MTPKQKAKELVNKMIIDFIDWTYFIPIDKTNNATIQTEAKQRALIAVEEILKLNHPIAIVYTETSDNLIEQYTQEYYWEQVKHELERL